MQAFQKDSEPLSYMYRELALTRDSSSDEIAPPVRNSADF